MNDSGPGGGGYFWCLRDSRVETGDDLCPAQYRLGPYATADEATRALETVERRNAEWNAQDARGTGQVSSPGSPASSVQAGSRSLRAETCPQSFARRNTLMAAAR